jgi:hypothetical protein
MSLNNDNECSPFDDYDPSKTYNEFDPGMAARKTVVKNILIDANNWLSIGDRASDGAMESIARSVVSQSVFPLASDSSRPPDLKFCDVKKLAYYIGMTIDGSDDMLGQWYAAEKIINYLLTGVIPAPTYTGPSN